MYGRLGRKVMHWPPWLYQRYRPLWERAVLAAGWALLYVLCDAAVVSVVAVPANVQAFHGSQVPAFAVQWRAFVAACIFVAGLYRPVLAYALFVVAVAYPLYLISVYVMALALAALVLSCLVATWVYASTRSPPFAVAGGWRRSDVWCIIALPVVGAPLLAPVHLAPVLPLLAGLWWGEVGGAIVGGLAALWLKICAAMAGSSLDLWSVSGWTMAIDPLYERFHTANSLQTLVRLIGPLIGLAEPWIGGGASPSLPDQLSLASRTLLFNLLQVIAWAAAGYVVGSVARWLQSNPSRSRFPDRAAARDRNGGLVGALGLGPGLWLIWAGYVLVPTWLQVEGPRWHDPRWLPAQVVWAGGVAWGTDSLVRYLRRPVGGEGKGSFANPFAVAGRWGRLGRMERAPGPRRRRTRSLGPPSDSFSCDPSRPERGLDDSDRRDNPPPPSRRDKGGPSDGDDEGAADGGSDGGADGSTIEDNIILLELD
jgi:hypothetical protein